MYVSAPVDPSPPSTSNFIPELPRSPLARPALDAEEVTLGGVEGVEATAPERARCGVEA